MTWHVRVALNVAARGVLHEAAVEPGNFAAFTVAALPRLEAPFLTAFAGYDAYRASLAAWQSRHAPVQMAAVAVESVAVFPTAPSMMLGVGWSPAAVPVPAVTSPVAASPGVLASVSTAAFGPQP